MNKSRVVLAAILVALIGFAAYALGPREMLAPLQTTFRRVVGEHISLQGYNFVSWGQISMTLKNTGDLPTTLDSVYYDGKKLRLGVATSPSTDPHYMMTVGKLETVPTNDIIFAPEGLFNVANRAGQSLTLPPSGMTVIYLGVTAPARGTDHEVKIITATGLTFVFIVTSGEQVNYRT